MPVTPRNAKIMKKQRNNKVFWSPKTLPRLPKTPPSLRSKVVPQGFYKERASKKNGASRSMSSQVYVGGIFLILAAVLPLNDETFAEQTLTFS